MHFLRRSICLHLLSSLIVLKLRVGKVIIWNFWLSSCMLSLDRFTIRFLYSDPCLAWWIVIGRTFLSKQQTIIFTLFTLEHFFSLVVFLSRWSPWPKLFLFSSWSWSLLRKGLMINVLSSLHPSKNLLDFIKLKIEIVSWALCYLFSLCERPSVVCN